VSASLIIWPATALTGASGNRPDPTESIRKPSGASSRNCATTLEAWRLAVGLQSGGLFFQQPEDLSPWVAEFYRWWNRRRDIEPTRLLVESFVVIEPFWVVRTGSVPFWMLFNVEPSARALVDYLAGTKGFEEIFLMLFSGPERLSQ
jgi:hypothetical protein